MRAVIQRVSQAGVEVDGAAVGSIGSGLVVLLAIEEGDAAEDLAFLKRKILNLRIFDDSEGKMNLCLQDVGGAILLISQFTLLGDCRKGNRPSYSKAADPETAARLYENLKAELKKEGLPVESGQFQAMMSVSLVNEGPVTLIIDSRQTRRQPLSI